MGIGVKRPKIDTSKIDSLLGNTPSSEVKVAEEPKVQQPIEAVKPVEAPIKDEKVEGEKTTTGETEVVVELNAESGEKDPRSEKIRVVLPSLYDIIENKSEQYAAARTSNITLPDTLIKELQKVALLGRKKAYARNILTNIVTAFLAAYKKEIDC